ncbi:MAG: glycosyltransferase family 9 protein [Betaproteobacteria bacterium]|nr:glycosyltransferase family 9 protein [Betaproteobacteria bacterium]
MRILVLHHLLLGDTLMLTGLLAKLRREHPDAKIAMTVAPAFAPLFAGRPYGVDAEPFDPREIATYWTLLARPRFDLVILPADNRYSWLARSLGARWIVGFAGDRPAHKNWPVDEMVAYSEEPAAFCDTATSLARGPAPPPYAFGDWPPPGDEDAPRIAGRYAVLHIGASTPLKRWEPACWRSLAAWLEGNGIAPVWSVGPGEEALLDAIRPDPVHPCFAGTLGLAGLWHLLARARLLVCPDTGVAHLGRIVGVPTVALFGPGSATICGAGAYFAASPYRAVCVDPFPCRDQTVQFFRQVPWVRRCERMPGTPPAGCARALCMEAIDVSAVTAAIVSLQVLQPSVTTSAAAGTD